MAYTEVGRIRPRARGVFDAYTSYEVMDIVTNTAKTAAYMAVKAVPAGTALANTDYWVVFADLSELKGEKGDEGVSITSVSVNEEGHLMIALSEGDPIDAGYVIGPQGQGITILGSYASEDELNAAHPTGNAGDAYLINGNLYVWSESTSTWENVGNIQGPKGDPGEITDEEKAEVVAELKSYVDTEILGGAW